MGRMKIIGNTEKETGMELENPVRDFTCGHILSPEHYCLPQHDAL
jgi:hypothetical protein